MKKRIAVIFGGRSGEHEVSIRSAHTVIAQADSSKYHLIPIAITHDGEWLSPAQSLALLPADAQERFRNEYGAPSEARLTLTGDPTVKGLIGLGWSGVEAVDCFFPVLHGTFGEDGTIQGLFEMASVPYVGCGVLASSCGMDKAFMRTLFRDAGLPMCDYVWFLRDEWERSRDAVIAQTAAKLGFPCFVKPANLGSSVGVSKATDDESLAEAIDVAALYDRKILVEEGLEMREIECSVIGNDSPSASLPGEYIIRDESKKFLDYTEKYSGTGNNDFVVPAPISDELSDRIRKMAIVAFRAIGGSGLARVDFFLRSDNGALLLNEVNTLPGLTDASGFPKMWAASGKPMTEVIDELIDLAIERHQDKLRNKLRKD
jgi:D-alanine-D-alanine ligase